MTSDVSEKPEPPHSVGTYPPASVPKVTQGPVIERMAPISTGRAPILRLSWVEPGHRHAEIYGAGADEYARVLDPWLEPILMRLVGLAEIAPGSRVLDVATGTGAVARLAAAAGAEVVGVDIAPGMIEVARRTSPPSIRFEVADAAALPYDDGPFDRVVCGFGLSHLPVGAALAELRRVLVPGGLLAACAWGAGGSSPAPAPEASALGDVIDEATWADPEIGSSLLRDAGLERVAVHTQTFSGSHHDADAALAWALAWPSNGAALDADARESWLRSARAAIGDLSWSFPVHYYTAVNP